MKKIIAVTALFIISTNFLFAQPQKRKVAPKKPNNFSFGATNPTVQGSKNEVSIETLEYKEGGVNDATIKSSKNPNQRSSGTKGKRQHKPIK